MSRYLLRLWGHGARAQAIDMVKRAPQGWLVRIEEPKRNKEQNDKMWAMLTDISIQVEHHGQRYTPEDWKLIFLAALNQEIRMAPSLSGSGMVPLGRSSSKLSKSEFSDLLELINAFAAEKGVVFNNEIEEQAA